MTNRTIRQSNPAIAEHEQLIAIASLLPGTEIHRMAQALRPALDLPDKFNAAFTSKGWLYVEFACGYEAALEALAMLEQGASAEAIEVHLADNLLAISPIYYQAIQHLGGGNVDPQHPIRAAVAERLFKAFEEEDYVVSVPLTLMLIDSFGISKSGTKSIFSDLSDLDHLFEAEQSVAGHPSGLKAVLKRLITGARGYSEETVALPLRNGILHGTRLNYASKVVAAKALNVLAGMIEWARDTDTEDQDEVTRRRWNENFLSKNLARINARSPDEALSNLQAAIRDGRPADAVALIDYHPTITMLRSKIDEWREVLNVYDIELRPLGRWEIFGEASASEQQARCEVELALRLKGTGARSVEATTLYATRSVELSRAGLPSVWQINIALLGTIRHRLPT